MSHNFRRVLPPDLTRVKRRRGRRGGRPGLRDMVRVVLHTLIGIGSASHLARVLLSSSGRSRLRLPDSQRPSPHQDLYIVCTPRGKDAARGRAPLPTTRSDGRPTARALTGVEYGTRSDCPRQRRLRRASWEQRGSAYGVSERSRPAAHGRSRCRCRDGGYS